MVKTEILCWTAMLSNLCRTTSACLSTPIGGASPRTASPQHTNDRVSRSCKVGSRSDNRSDIRQSRALATNPAREDGSMTQLSLTVEIKISFCLPI